MQEYENSKRNIRQQGTMTNPIRVQRKRTKGFKLPPNTVCVTRGTKYGNPFKVSNGCIVFKVDKNRELPLYMLKNDDDPNFILSHWYGLFITGAREFAGIKLPDWKQFNPLPIYEIKALKGKNIACFCNLDKDCHGDFILTIANS